MTRTISPPRTPEQRDLVRAHTGEDAALVRVLDRHGHLIRGWARAAGSRLHEVAEVEAQVLIDLAYGEIAQYDPTKGAPASYLAGVTRNAARKVIATRGARVGRAVAREFDDAFDRPDRRQAAQRAAQEDIEHALRACPPRTCEVVRLAVLNIPTDDVAEELGVSARTVRRDLELFATMCRADVA